MIKEIKFDPYLQGVIQKKRLHIFVKRCFDILLSFFLILFFLPLMIIVAILIFMQDGENPIFVQERVTTLGKIFKIFKFRTMPVDDETDIIIRANNDISKLGLVLRKYKIDEIPQLFNILSGDMSFVGTRPEVPFFVNQYSRDMLSTLLLPAGLTSVASIKFADEYKFFEGVDDPNFTYVNDILPLKMKYNLEYIENFSFFYDLKILILTVIAVLK